MENTEASLLEKLRNDLNAIVSNNEIFKKTQDDLNRFCKTHSGVVTATELEEIFEDCYHELVSFENKGSLTVEQTALLTDLDELEDYWAHRKWILGGRILLGCVFCLS